MVKLNFRPRFFAKFSIQKSRFIVCPLLYAPVKQFVYKMITFQVLS
jgi:hypothetical protein